MMKLLRALLLILVLTGNGFADEPPFKPQRIVSTCLPGDQFLLHLVPGKRIVALSLLATDADLSAHWKQARDFPMTRGGAEELARLNPDLVVASKYGTHLPFSILRERGVRVLELGVPNNFDELREQIRLVGRTLGEEARAEQWVSEMDARLERLKAKRPAPGARPTALLYFQDGFTPGAHAFANAILEAAGFENLGARFSPGVGACAPLEAILMARPQFLILTRYYDANPTQTQLSISQPLFSKLGAQTKVIQVAFLNLASPDPSNLELAEILQSYLPQ